MESEVSYWAAALALVLVPSVIIFAARLYRIHLFTIEFELCIFYIPTIVLGAILIQTSRQAH